MAELLSREELEAISRGVFLLAASDVAETALHYIARVEELEREARTAQEIIYAIEAERDAALEELERIRVENEKLQEALRNLTTAASEFAVTAIVGADELMDEDEAKLNRTLIEAREALDEDRPNEKED
jgi:uncharacterized protein (DUF3084 family)